MKEFSTIESIYKYLENNAYAYQSPSDISGLFQKLRDNFYKEKLTNEAEIAQWEMDVFSFNIHFAMVNINFINRAFII